MVTVTIELEDAVYERLKAEVAGADDSVERLLTELISSRYAARDAARRHLQRYPRLFQRLAE